MRRSREAWITLLWPFRGVLPLLVKQLEHAQLPTYKLHLIVVANERRDNVAPIHAPNVMNALETETPEVVARNREPCGVRKRRIEEPDVPFANLTPRVVTL